MIKRNINHHGLNYLWLTRSPLQQSGVSLLITMIGMLAMTMAGLGIMRASNTSNLIAANMGFHQAAVQSGDLGVEAAIPVYQGIINADATLADDTSQNYYASYSGDTLPPSSRLSDSTPNQVSDAHTDNVVGYVIERMCSDTNAATTTNCLMKGSDPYFRITTQIKGPRDTLANTQTYVTGGGDGFAPECAITVDTYLEAPGTPNLLGDKNCMHSNDYVDVGGGSGSLGEVRAVNAVSDNTKITDMGGTPLPNQPAVVLPEIVPSDFKQYADVVFKADGHVYTSGGTVDEGTSWQGWERTTLDGEIPVVWDMSNSSPSSPGLYYFEGNAVVSASVGSPGSEWNVSFVAENSIQIAGECYFENYIDAGDPEGVNNILMMAGGDLEYNGNPTQSVTGIMAVGEEIKINGNPYLEGYIIAANENSPGDTSADVSLIDKNELSGNFIMNYDSSTTLTSPWGEDLIRHAWRSIGD